MKRSQRYILFAGLGVALFIAEWAYFDARIKSFEASQVRLASEDAARSKIEKKVFGINGLLFVFLI